MVSKKIKRDRIGYLLLTVGFILFSIASLSIFAGSDLMLRLFESKINMILFIGIELFLFIKGAMILGE